MNGLYLGEVSVRLVLMLLLIIAILYVTGSVLNWRNCGGSWRTTARWLAERSKRSWKRPERSRRGDTR